MAIRKGGKAGKSARSVVSFWGVAPGQPYIVSVVPTGGGYLSSSAIVTFNKNVMGATPSSYTIYANSQYGTLTFTASSSPFTATGLRAGTTYAFTILANATIGQESRSEVSVSSDQTNADSTGTPDAPTAPSASSPSGATYDSISWSAPSNGGYAITNYQIESSDGKSTTTNGLSVNIEQEANTSQQYRVRAYNSHGWGDWSGWSGTVTTFSFVPFSVFGFSPFGVFGFSPFGVFGFSPFGVFGFSPFSVFGFSPFGFSPFGVFGFSPFGFSPFGVFGFSPFGFSPFGFGGCIHEDTLVSVVNEANDYVQIPVKDVVAGQEIWCYSFDELEDEGDGNPYGMSLQTLSNAKLVKTNVANITQKTMPATMWLNGQSNKKFSTMQGFLVKRNGQYIYIESGQIVVGDYVLEYNHNLAQFLEVEVTAVDVDNTEATVYRIDAEPIDTLIGGDYLLHNPKARAY